MFLIITPHLSLSFKNFLVLVEELPLGDGLDDGLGAGAPLREHVGQLLA